MATGAIICNNGKNAMWKRGFSSSITVFSQWRIGTGTTTPAAADTGLQTPLSGWASGGLDYKNFMTGYPTYDTGNRRVTWRGQVLSTEANGNTITELAEFNTDGTPIMLSRTVHLAISKSSSVTIIYEVKHKIS